MAVYFEAAFQGGVGFTPALEDTSSPFTSAFTVAVLMRQQSTGGSNGDGAGIIFNLSDGTNEIGFYAEANGAIGTFTSTPGCNAGSIDVDGIYSWFFITVASSGGAANTYTADEGGSLVTESSGSWPAWVPTLLTIARNRNTNEGWPGHIGAFHVWDKVLSSTEMGDQALQRNAVATADLIAEYRMDDVASVATDSSGNGNHLTEIEGNGVFQAATVDPTIPDTVGGGAEDLTPDLLTNTSSLYAPATVLELRPALLTNSSTVYVPSVAQDARPALMTNTSSLYSPAVGQEARPGLLTNISALYDPSAATGQSVEPALLTNTSSVFGALTSKPYARLFFSGHSLSDNPLPEYVDLLASDAGRDSDWNQQVVIGSPIRVRTDGNTTGDGVWDGYSSGENRTGSDMDVVAELRDPATLGTGERYDSLVITERHDPITTVVWENTFGYLRHFHDRLVESTAEGTTFLYSCWHDVDKTDPQPWIDYEQAALVFWEGISSYVNHTLEADGQTGRIEVIPGNAALVALVEEIIAGNVSGFTTGTTEERLDLLFTDDVHLSSAGMYFMACVTYACVFRASPVGLDIPDGVIYPTATHADASAMSSATAADFQAIAWDYVHTYLSQENPGVRTMADVRSLITAADGAVQLWHDKNGTSATADLDWYDTEDTSPFVWPDGDWEALPPPSLAPALLVNTSVVYAPTVSGAQLVAPDLLTNSSTVSAPAVAQQARPELVSNSSTVYAPSTTQEARPALLSSSSTVYAPAVVYDQTLAPALLANTSTLYAPTVFDASAELFRPITATLVRDGVTRATVANSITTATIED